MAAAPRVRVVEIDGLWFRIQKLRGRRAFRGARALQVTLGLGGYNMVRQPKFWDPSVTSKQRLTALVSVRSLTKAGYDELEAAFVELLAHDGREGVSYRDSPPDPERPDVGWVPIRDMSTLDNFDAVDDKTWEAIHWEMIKLGYRPTFAATGTDAGTRPEATTSTQTSGPSGSPEKPPSGPPRPAATRSGISAG